jgi:hypothetical protein
MRDSLVLTLRLLAEGRITGDEARRLVEGQLRQEGEDPGRLGLGALLAMVGEHRLTPEAAAERLTAAGTAPGTDAPEAGPRWMRIVVTDGRDHAQRVNVRLPLAVVRAGLSLVDLLPAKVVTVNGRSVDLATLVGELRDAAPGQVLTAEAGSEQIEILLE